MSVYSAMVAAGIPTDHHESDLYVKDTPEARAILMTHDKKPGTWGCPGFTSAIDGTRWLDVPFCYDPYWEKRGAKAD